MLDDISDLEEKIASNRSEITILREVFDRGRVEKLELRYQVRLLERDLEHREADAEELRNDSEYQINHYNELWIAHSNLLMEMQVSRSQVTILRSGE